MPGQPQQSRWILRNPRMLHGQESLPYGPHAVQRPLPVATIPLQNPLVDCIDECPEYSPADLKRHGFQSYTEKVPGQGRV